MLNALAESEISEMNEVMKEEITGFKVSDLDSANWAFRKIAALNEQIKENQDLAAREKLRIETWEKKENESSRQTIEYFEGLLKQYYKELRESNPKAKVSTPYGKITSKESTKWHYEEDKLLEYLKENDSELVKVKTEESINKVDLKKKYKDGVNAETGEILPFIEVKKELSITIKVD